MIKNLLLKNKHHNHIFFKFISQLISFGIIGLLCNIIGYLLYLFLNYYWEAPKTIMTILFIIGTFVSFFANRRFTFKQSRSSEGKLLKYFLVFFKAYLFNLVLLLVFVDWLGLAHQIIQGISIIIVALYTFLMSQFFIFNDHQRSAKKKIN